MTEYKYEFYEFEARLNDLQKDYVRACAELEGLRARLAVLRGMFKDNKDIIWGYQATAVMGWEPLPERKEEVKAE